MVKTEEDLLLLVDPGTLSYIHLICNGCSVHTYMNTVVRHVLLLSGKHHRSSYGHAMYNASIRTDLRWRAVYFWCTHVVRG